MTAPSNRSRKIVSSSDGQTGDLQFLKIKVCLDAFFDSPSDGAIASTNDNPDIVTAIGLQLFGIGHFESLFLLIEKIDKLDEDQETLLILEWKLLFFELKIAFAPASTAFGIDEKEKPYFREGRILFFSFFLHTKIFLNIIIS